MHLSDMPFCCYNLLKYYSIILGVPGAAIIPKLQSCIPIVVSVCCLLASSRSGGANSSHSRLHLLQGFSKHRLHAILVTFVFTRPKILCNLCQLMLEMKFPFLFNICFPHSLRSSSIADPLLGLAAELLLSWDTIWPQLSVWWLYQLIHVGEKGWQPCWNQNSEDCIFWFIQRSMWRA